jgi:putative adhesin
MRRSSFAASALLVSVVLLSSIDTEGLARATRGVIALPRLVQRNAQDFQWRGAVLQGSTIEIKGVNGDVTAEPAAGAEVEVTAERRGRRSNPEDVRIEVVQHGDGVTICAVYPSRDSSRPNECRPGSEGRMNVQNNDVTVRFAVRVPPGVRFAGRTVNGDVEAQNLAGPVALNTVNGSTTFSTSSYGEASTVNGSIRGTLGDAAWSNALAFKTVNGSITLDLPADMSADVRAATVNGEISTDFPITVTGRISRRQLTGTIGSGGRSLELDTVNGSVRLRRR